MNEKRGMDAHFGSRIVGLSKKNQDCTSEAGTSTLVIHTENHYFVKFKKGLAWMISIAPEVQTPEQNKIDQIELQPYEYKILIAGFKALQVLAVLAMTIGFSYIFLNVFLGNEKSLASDKISSDSISTNKTLLEESTTTTPDFKSLHPMVRETCDSGIRLSTDEREAVLKKLGTTETGAKLLLDFINQYSSLDRLSIEWNQVSFSQVINLKALKAKEDLPGNRSLANEKAEEAQGSLGAAICVHLAHKLPPIEHLADLAHELTHVTRLRKSILDGEVDNASEFVKARLSEVGGEADAFAFECKVKEEFLGKWDDFCRPYLNETGSGIDQMAVVKDFYKGGLSASLTGESYPVMLAKQYQAMLDRKQSLSALKRVSNSATNRYSRRQ